MSDNKIEKVLDFDDNGIELLIPAFRMILSKDNLKTLRFIEGLDMGEASQALDKLKLSHLYFDDNNIDNLLELAKGKINSFQETNKAYPDIIVIKNMGMIVVGNNAKHCDRLVDAIDNYKNYEGKIVVENKNSGRAENKTIIVTGAAQGFGEGIARNLLNEGANIIVADLNEQVGQKTVDLFNASSINNKAIFVKTDVSNISSIKNLMRQTIINFGGIDTFISNAGVLRAGGLDDMTPEDFDFVTKINYNAYFYCTKVVSAVMKQQTKFATAEYYADVIQINSKSGLRGSRANFAYAGGKFGGIGLTQSFALELAPYRIKVNSICPGNYYEGPLWSDPDNGLFIQYLNAGKVPEAKTIDDVKAFYLAQVPMNKGCTPEDVTKGALYLMEQCGETGQALPITGGQVMLN